MITVKELIEFLSSGEIDQDAIVMAECTPNEPRLVRSFYPLTSSQGTDDAGLVLLIGYEDE